MSKEKLKNKNHTSHITLQKNNGITLIALIITIIVMLILTGVTLSITLGDNGLVNKAKEATTQTQVAMDRELLLSAVVGAVGNDGKVNLSAIVLPEGFTGSNGTYTSKNGNAFTVTSDGKIEIAENGEGNGNNETISNPWIERGLSANWAYGKWYALEENGARLLKLYADGGLFLDGEEISSQQFEEDCKDMFELNDEEFVLIDAGVIITLNSDGTAKAYNGDEWLTLIIIEDSEYEYNLDGTYINENGNQKFIFNSEDKSFYAQYKDGDLWRYTSSIIDGGENGAGYWKYKGKYYINGNLIDMTVSEDFNIITYRGEKYTKVVN